VPRNFKCTSRHFINFINFFGNEQGFDKILELLENAESSENVDIMVLINLSILISLPAIVYHKTFVQEYGDRIIKAIKARLLGSQDKSIRDIDKEKVGVLYGTISGMQRRFMEREDSQRELEIFKLEMCKKYLKSDLLEPRITAIRELNSIIDNNKSYSLTKALTLDFIINWMTENNVINTIWDVRRTHQ